MPRPTLLVAEPEPAEALSVRKLVLETAKFNVLTAHSTREALELSQQFPLLSAVILILDSPIDCEAVANAIKQTCRTIPIITLSSRIGAWCTYADHQLSSHEPEELLELVRSVLGDPRKAA